MGVREKVALLVTVIVIIGIASTSCMPRSDKKSALKQYYNNLRKSKVNATPKVPKRLSEKSTRLPKNDIGLGQENQPINKAFNFPEIEYPRMSNVYQMPPDTLTDAPSIVTSSKDSLISQNANNDGLVKYLDSLRTKAKLKRKIGNANNVKNVSSTSEKTNCETDPFCFKNVGTFPDVEYPQSVSETWMPNFWNYMPYFDNKETADDFKESRVKEIKNTNALPKNYKSNNKELVKRLLNPNDKNKTPDKSKLAPFYKSLIKQIKPIIKQAAEQSNARDKSYPANTEAPVLASHDDDVTDSYGEIDNTESIQGNAIAETLAPADIPVTATTSPNSDEESSLSSDEIASYQTIPKNDFYTSTEIPASSLFNLETSTPNSIPSTSVPTTTEINPFEPNTSDVVMGEPTMNTEPPLITTTTSYPSTTSFPNYSSLSSTSCPEEDFTTFSIIYSQPTTVTPFLDNIDTSCCDEDILDTNVVGSDTDLAENSTTNSTKPTTPSPVLTSTEIQTEIFYGVSTVTESSTYFGELTTPMARLDNDLVSPTYTPCEPETGLSMISSTPTTLEETDSYPIFIDETSPYQEFTTTAVPPFTESDYIIFSTIVCPTTNIPSTIDNDDPTIQSITIVSTASKEIDDTDALGIATTPYPPMIESTMCPLFQPNTSSPDIDFIGTITPTQTSDDFTLPVTESPLTLTISTTVRPYGEDIADDLFETSLVSTTALPDETTDLPVTQSMIPFYYDSNTETNADSYVNDIPLKETYSFTTPQATTMFPFSTIPYTTKDTDSKLPSDLTIISEATVADDEVTSKPIINVDNTDMTTVPPMTTDSIPFYFNEVQTLAPTATELETDISDMVTTTSIKETSPNLQDTNPFEEISEISEEQASFTAEGTTPLPTNDPITDAPFINPSFITTEPNSNDVYDLVDNYKTIEGATEASSFTTESDGSFTENYNTGDIIISTDPNEDLNPTNAIHALNNGEVDNIDYEYPILSNIIESLIDQYFLDLYYDNLTESMIKSEIARQEKEYSEFEKNPLNEDTITDENPEEMTPPLNSDLTTIRETGTPEPLSSSPTLDDDEDWLSELSTFKDTLTKALQFVNFLESYS